MHVPRLPDWLIYATVVLAILFASLGRRERLNAPPAPPPVPGADQMPIDPASPFGRATIVHVRRSAERAAVTAFSVGDGGVWLTARRAIDGCRQAAILIAPGRGVAARPRAGSGDMVVLATDGGAPPMPLDLSASPATAALAFQPGFVRGAPGEAATRLLGGQTLPPGKRGQPPDQVLAWAEVGRTDGLKGDLGGLSGAPVLDGDGRVIGVTLAEAPRRGRLYAATPQAMARALAAAGVPPPAAAGQTITADNYGRMADGLRLALSIAPVVCLAA